MKPAITSVIFVGFRGTGKSTIAKIVAEKLGWQLIETDDVISQKTGKTIPQLTQNGTAWDDFRKIEHETIKEILSIKNVVISSGGGVFVNLINAGGTKTYGQLSTEILKQHPEILVIGLTCSEELLRQRITLQEMASESMVRPILSITEAKKLQTLLDQYANDPQKQKEITVTKIVEDSIRAFEARRAMYKALTKHQIDTTDLTVDQVVKKIMLLIKRKQQ